MKNIIGIFLVLALVCSPAFALIEENISVVRERGGALNNALGEALSFLSRYQRADTFATLTAEQKQTAIAQWSDLSEVYISAKNSFEEAVTATEPIGE